jgi:hypothetical protein
MSRIIEAEETDPASAILGSLLEQYCYRSGTARARWAGLPWLSPARGAPDAAPQAPP